VTSAGEFPSETIANGVFGATSDEDCLLAGR
jgi:hypothetical protein